MRLRAVTLRQRGFTLIELAVTLALVGLVAITSLPMYDVVVTRMKETELRQALRSFRNALDAYKAAADTGLIAKAAGASGYPPSLDVLVQGVEVGVPGATTLTGQQAPQRMVFLRQIPRDPFFADPTVPAAQTWRTRAYASPADNPQSGDDVFDVTSSSNRVGLNGQPYNTW